MTGAVAILLLVAMRASPTTGNLLAFVTVFTAAGLWLLGFTRTPAFVRRARREAAARPREATGPRLDVAEHTFRVSVKPSGQAVGYFTSAAVAASGAWVIFSGATDPRWGNNNDMVVLGSALVGTGLFLGYYLWRAGRGTVRVGPRGIDADVLLGKRSIAWDDIVIVCRYGVSGTGSAGQLESHVVHARDRFIRLPANLEHRDDLVATVLANCPATRR